MNYRIVWTEEAINTFTERINYLEEYWTEIEIKKFKIRLKEYLEVLAAFPFIGKKPGKLKDVFMGLLIKPVSIIYKVDESKMIIELIAFIDNRRNPDHLKRFI